MRFRRRVAVVGVCAVVVCSVLGGIGISPVDAAVSPGPDSGPDSLSRDAVRGPSPAEGPAARLGSAVTDTGDGPTVRGRTNLSAGWLRGSGTRGDPYVVTNASGLQAVADDLDAHYVLGTDVDASGTAGWDGGRGFDPLGARGTDAVAFSGSFDGAGHAITGLSIDRAGSSEVALFGAVGSGGVVRNLTLRAVDVSGGRLTAGLAGANSGTVEAVSVEGSVVGSQAVGGVVGTNTGGTARRAASRVRVNGSEAVGGLVGINYGTVRNASATGAVSATREVGGLAGSNRGGTVADSFAAGPVTGVERAGGLVGASVVRYDYQPTETDAYWDVTASGQDTSAGEATGLTTTEMTGESAVDNMTGVSFPEPWQVRPGTYPGHAWRVNGPPRAAIDFETPVAVGERVTLDAGESADDGTIVAYEWTVEGEGTTQADGRTVAHTFTANGTATVRLVVTDDDGKSTVATRNVTVRANRPPTAAFDYLPTDPRPTEPITFDADGAADPDGSVTVYRWDLDGDGVFDRTGRRVTARYATVGERSVRLHVRDDSNVTDTTTRTVGVVANERPNLSVSGPDRAVIDETVTLTATASDPDGTVRNLTWDVDDDGTTEATGRTVQTAFRTAGAKTVIATARDDLGGTTSRRVDLTVAIDRNGAESVTPPAHPRFRVDAAGTGHDPNGTGPVGDIRTSWTFGVGSRVFTSPVVANGTVYAGSYSTTQGDRIVAVDTATGTSVWEFRTDSPVGGNPTVWNGTLYVGTDAGTLYALDADTGRERWASDTGTTLSAPAVVDGVAYVGGNGLYALDAATGERLFRTPTTADSSPAVANDTVYVGTESGSVLAVDATTGLVRWSTPTNGTVESSPAVVNGTVYVGSHDGHVYAMDAANGTVRWRHRTDGLVRSSPAVADGTVYVGSDDGYVYAIDAVSGGTVWRVETYDPRGTDLPGDNRVSSSPVVVGDTVYVGNDGHYVYGIDATTGATRWAYPTGYDVYATPAVVDGTAYAASVDGSLYALSGSLPTRDGDPTAVAGATPARPIPGERLVLDASASRAPDGGSVSVEWTQVAGPDAPLSGAGTTTPTATVPAGSAGETLTFRVVVRDADGDADAAVVRVPVERPTPTVGVGAVQGVPGTTTRVPVRLDVAPAGLSGYRLSVTIDNESVGRLTGIEDGYSSVRPTVRSNDTYTFRGRPNVTAPIRDVRLATLVVATGTAGRSPLHLTVDSLTHPASGGDGSPTEAAYSSVDARDGTLTVVRSPFPGGLPGGTSDAPPIDTDGDGTVEDVTGDGQFSFTDVVEFVFALEALSEATLNADQVATLDHSGDGKVTFADVVDLVFDL